MAPGTFPTETWKAARPTTTTVTSLDQSLADRNQDVGDGDGEEHGREDSREEQNDRDSGRHEDAQQDATPIPGH